VCCSFFAFEVGVGKIIVVDPLGFELSSHCFVAFVAFGDFEVLYGKELVELVLTALLGKYY
jgi:hypothetical protein